jgi:hypothetical protein
LSYASQVEANYFKRKYHIEKTMGEGGYGKVYKCVLKKELRTED